MTDGDILLVVDDEAPIRELMSTILEDEGYRVFSAQDGEKAWELLQDVDPSLVLLDIRMPKMTGKQFIEKAESEGNVVPIIVISAEAKPQDIKRKTGHLGFLKKPFDLHDLLEIVREHLPRKHRNHELPFSES